MNTLSNSSLIRVPIETKSWCDLANSSSESIPNTNTTASISYHPTKAPATTIDTITVPTTSRLSSSSQINSSIATTHYTTDMITILIR